MVVIFRASGIAVWLSLLCHFPSSIFPFTVLQSSTWAYLFLVFCLKILSNILSACVFDENCQKRTQIDDKLTQLLILPALFPYACREEGLWKIIWLVSLIFFGMFSIFLLKNAKHVIASGVCMCLCPHACFVRMMACIHLTFMWMSLLYRIGWKVAFSLETCMYWVLELDSIGSYLLMLSWGFID